MTQRTQSYEKSVENDRTVKSFTLTEYHQTHKQDITTTKLSRVK